VDGNRELTPPGATGADRRSAPVPPASGLPHPPGHATRTLVHRGIERRARLTAAHTNQGSLAHDLAPPLVAPLQVQ